MKRIFLLLCLLSYVFAYSQSQQIADDYFKRGEFKKALNAYQKLSKKNPSNYTYALKMVKTHQQLEQLDEAETILKSKIVERRNPIFLVELGYNFQLKDSITLATKYYNDAIAVVEKNPNYDYMVARQFEEHSLLDKAIATYKKGMALNPNRNYNLQLARLYGDKGNIEFMFLNYMDYIDRKPEFLNNTKRHISDFISENNESENNIIFKKILLKKLQAKPDVHWYKLLSWLFIQEKSYKKAFTQEKALFKRNPSNISRIVELAITTFSEKQYDISTETFNYIIENTQDIETIINSHQYLLDIKIALATTKDYPEIDKKYKSLFTEFGRQEQTLPLQIVYGNFLALNLNKPKEASLFLKEALTLRLSPFQEAQVKLKLGDILVFQEKFNEALIYYTQIQNKLKNSTISQEARFRVAKTSYYKGDFDWAESQLKILKSSTTQLIANDALNLKLLISDNKYDDSLHVALKLYAKADLFSFQNKTDKAITLLNKIITEHKGESIEDQALYKQAKLFEQKKQYNKAVVNYQAIITTHKDEILADDAYYYLAELYNNELGDPEKAKPLYEQIIFNHEDSIYFVEARKKYRAIRGDVIN